MSEPRREGLPRESQEEISAMDTFPDLASLSVTELEEPIEGQMGA